MDRPVYRSCLHDTPEGTPCARCDDMRLADVPEPKTPALPRRSVLRPEQHEPGFVRVNEGAFERVALVSPEAARRIAVIDTALEKQPALRSAMRDLRDHWRETAEDREERARTGAGEQRERLLAVAREARQSEALYAAVLGEDPGAGASADGAHAPKVQAPEPSRETQ